MQIQITEKQFENLLKLTYLGNWLVNSCRDEAVVEFEELEQLLWQKAKESGMDHLTAVDDESGEMIPSPELEEILDTFIDEYDDDISEESLAQQLAFRDLAKQLGKKIKKLPAEELEDKALPLFERYRDEFEKHGLENLVLKK